MHCRYIDIPIVHCEACIGKPLLITLSLYSVYWLYKSHKINLSVNIINHPFSLTFIDTIWVKEKKSEVSIMLRLCIWVCICDPANLASAWTSLNSPYVVMKQHLEHNYALVLIFFF